MKFRELFPIYHLRTRLVLQINMLPIGGECFPSLKLTLPTLLQRIPGDVHVPPGDAVRAEAIGATGMIVSLIANDLLASFRKIMTSISMCRSGRQTTRGHGLRHCD